jgi:hypothetical protein
MRIYGAGMAGLLAGQMLRRHAPTIHDAQASLPNNHGALLRFRSDIVSKATGIPLDRVSVMKGISQRGNALPLALANQYSRKVTGDVMPRSVIDLTPGDRWVARPDFLSQLATGLQVQLGIPLTLRVIQDCVENDLPIISTIPMPALMEIVGWPEKVEFSFRPVWSLKCVIQQPVTRVYQTIYYPGSEPYYRASITGNQLIVEFAGTEPDATLIKEYVSEVLIDFGFSGQTMNVTEPVLKHQQYGKLLPIDERQRRSFILAMSDEYGIYSVGRFATWRQLLLDDVVNDVRVVEEFIAERGSYARALKGRR